MWGRGVFGWKANFLYARQLVINFYDLNFCFPIFSTLVQIRGEEFIFSINESQRNERREKTLTNW